MLDIVQAFGFTIWNNAASYNFRGLEPSSIIGFIEPNKITQGYCDIILSDGYTGNIILKTAEGLSEFITLNLKNKRERLRI